ncbi:MAG: ABC transporter permease [Chloroflexi bacterium]|nr:ABC transporter permease [Chloroflexota bacterium]
MKIEVGSTLWFLLRDRAAVISTVFLVTVALTAVFAPLLTPYAAQGMGHPDLSRKFVAPGIEHPFGTDGLGRDQVARLMFGARRSLSMGVLVVLAAIGIGTPLGLIAGYLGGWVDEALMRITDVFLAFPPLLLAIAIAAALGASYVNAVAAIAVTWWPWYARLARSQTLSVRERAYIEAARGIGVRHRVIMRRHVLPNILTPIVVQGTLDVGTAILVAAGLSFIGLGTQAPYADWGVMISDGRLYFLSGRWWLSTFPGLAIFLTAMAFNFLGDGVRVAADPRLRRTL